MEKYTTRRRASEFLTKNQIIRKILENEKAAIIVTDKRSIVELINPEFTKLFGYSVKEVVGKYINDIIIHEHSNGDLRKPRYTYKGESKSEMKIIRSKKSGKRLSVLSRLTPIMMGNEAIGGLSYYWGVN